MQDPRKNKKKLKRVSTAVISATFLTASAAGIVLAYQSGSAFHPSGKNQDLKKNQIVFSKNKKITGQKSKKDKSSFLKNDQENKNGAQKQDNADYMFKNKMTVSDQNPVRITTNSNVQQTNNSSNDSGKNYYQVTKDPSKADIVVDDPTNKEKDSSNKSNENGNNPGNGSDSNHNNSNNDSNQNNNKDNDHDSDTNKEKHPSDTAKDPESEKQNNINTISDTKPFVDNIEPYVEDDENGDNRSVVIEQSESNTNAILYKGQSIKEKDLFNSLDTYVRGKDGKVYVWGKSSYDRYIKIHGVSFDGGKKWINKYPTTIPANINSEKMKIKVSYRLSEKKKWVTRIVDYAPKDSRVFLLSQKITEENTTISDSMIVNKYDQYPELGSTMNLLKLQNDYLGDGNLTSLFPGWMEKGKLQPWFYEVKAGRHILEPADMVPLDEKYIASLEVFWMNDDGDIDPDGNNLIYLQTLTDMNDVVAVNWLEQDWLGSNAYQTISVPKYMQAVSIDSDADISVNYLEVPDTVLYIKLDDSGMRVNEGYKVDKNNKNYMSTKAGILLTKDETEIIGIPYKTEKLEIEDSVKRVRIEEKNQLSEIDLSTKTLEKMPTIDYSKLSNCKMIVPDDILISYIQNNYNDIFANKGNTVAASSNPSEEYVVEKEMILSKEGRMVTLAKPDKKQLYLTDSVTSVAENALNGEENLQTVIMPQSGKTVSFEKNSFLDSHVKTIQCYSKEQYDSVLSQLEHAGAPTDITVQMIETSKEGYKYYIQQTEDKKDVILLSVPKTVTQFDGKMTDENGITLDITEIGNEAFAECEDLVWVTLPESIKKIGQESFENCTALEGMVINSRDEITIGDKSFDGCKSLRFIGSNAKKGIMENDYAPMITDSYVKYPYTNRYFYVPGDCEGYNQACVSMTSGSDTPLSGYCMKDLGDNSKMLYGVDDDGNPWIALRSGKTVPDQVELPKETVQLFNYAMADTVSKSGKYQINLEQLEIINNGAFCNSELSGDLIFHENVKIYDDAMSGCNNITSAVFPGDDIYFGDNLFNNCSKLKSATFGKNTDGSGIQTGMFTGCDKLRDITFTSKDVESLMLIDGTKPYQFNMDWTQEEEMQQLSIHIPEGSEISYIKGWRFIYCGYVDGYNQSAYSNMRNAIEDENTDWDIGKIPTDEEIDVIQKERLLEAENRIRTMIGINQVSEPTDLYLYHESSEGMITLADVTTQAETLTLLPETLELPEGWFVDYIGTGAFKNAKNLKKIIIPDTMAGILDKAFEGMQSGFLELEFDAAQPLELMLNDDKQPFDFGMKDENLTIRVPEDSKTEYLRSWIFPMAGYKDVSDMEEAIKEEISTKDGQQDSKILHETMAQELLPIENRLRKMMGMEEIHNISEMCYKDDWGLSDETDEEVPAEEVEKTNEQAEDSSKDTDAQEEDTKKIIIPKTTTQINSDLYANEKKDQLELTFESETPLKLQIEEEGKEFSFGKEDAKVTIHVPKGCEETYIKQWKYAMAGYEDLESMKKAIEKDRKEQEKSEDQVDEIISQKLLLGENRLRKMMKMEEK